MLFGESMLALFGDKLLHLRRRHKLTQIDLGQRLDAKRAHISNLEAGRRAPSLDLVVRAADLFGVTTDYLLLDSIPVEAVTAHTGTQSPDLPLLSQLFGAKLRQLRKLHNVTQLELIQRLGLKSQSHISLMEADQSDPSIEMVIQLAGLFGVTTDYLLRDSPSL